LDQNVQKESTHKFVLYISMTLAFGILWVIFLFKIEFLFRFLSAIFINSILWTMETLAKGVAYFFPEIHGGFREEILEKANGLYDYLVGDKQHPPTGDFVIRILGIIAILTFIGLIIFLTFRHFQRRFFMDKDDKTNAALNYGR